MGSCMLIVAYISTALCIQAGLQCNISAYTAQNTIHLKFNFYLLILDKISMEAVAAVTSMLVTVLESYAYAI